MSEKLGGGRRKGSKPLITAPANCHQQVETRPLALIDAPPVEFAACIDERLTDWIPLAAASRSPPVLFFHLSDH